jgi:four helix bundle protein
MGFRSHEESDAWQLADIVRSRVFVLTGRAAFRDGGLRRQLREAAHSSCTNIAEGFGRYRPREFARFLEIASGSMKEVLEHLAEPGLRSMTARQEIAEISLLARRARGAMIGLLLYLKSCDDPSKNPNRLQAARDNRKKRSPPNRRTQEPENPRTQEPQNPRTPEPQNP